MKGFLLAECNRLAGMRERTTSLKKLYHAATEATGARAREYVFLFALETGKLDALARQADKDGTSQFAGQCRRIIPMAAPFEGDAERFLETHGNRLGKRYAQVLDAFREPEAHRENDARVKGIMRERTVEGLRASGKTPYRMACDLGLNRGNMYAYLRGDVSKVSRGTARRMYDYALG